VLPSLTRGVPYGGILGQPELTPFPKFEKEAEPTGTFFNNLESVAKGLQIEVLNDFLSLWPRENHVIGLVTMVSKFGGSFRSRWFLLNICR
jgi:hypothetical protein